MPQPPKSSRHDPRYWLRYVVPPDEVSRAERELMARWNRGDIQGVLLFVGNAEERGIGLNSVEEVRDWYGEIQPILDAFRENRVPWGFNIWQTIGFSRFAPGLRRAAP